MRFPSSGAARYTFRSRRLLSGLPEGSPAVIGERESSITSIDVSCAGSFRQMEAHICGPTLRAANFASYSKRGKYRVNYALDNA